MVSHVSAVLALLSKETGIMALPINMACGFLLPAAKPTTTASAGGRINGLCQGGLSTGAGSKYDRKHRRLFWKRLALDAILVSLAEFTIIE